MTDAAIIAIAERIERAVKLGIGDRYLDTAGVADLLGYTTPYTRDKIVHAPGFPAPSPRFKHGRWLSSDVLRWGARKTRVKAPTEDVPKKSRHELYNTWKKMHDRCSNPNASQYRWYGARGITVCARWDNFERFLTDMGPRPSPEHTLDRIDNYRGYSPENCRWATQKEQYANRRCPRCDKCS